MTFRFFVLPVLTLFFSLTSLQGQTLIARGGIMAEVAVVAGPDRIYVSYKGADTVVVPEERTPGAFYNAVDLPLGAKGATFGFGYFASHLLALSPEGTILWKKKYGRSRSSRPSGIAVDRQGGVVAAAPAPERSNEVVVERIDPDGTILWRTRIDSLTDVPRVVLTDDPWLTLLGWHEATRSIRTVDSSVFVGTHYNASTVRLTVDSGKGIRTAGHPVITSESVLGAMAGTGFATPVSSRQTDWLTWKGDSLVLYTIRAADKGNGAFTLSLPKEADGMRIRKGIFRNGSYAAIGNPGESEEMLVAAVRYGEGSEVTRMARSLKGLKGMAILHLSFNQSGGLTVGGAIDNRVKVVELDNDLTPVDETEHTIDARNGVEVAVAAIEPAVGGGYHVLWVTEGGEEHLLWYERVE